MWPVNFQLAGWTCCWTGIAVSSRTKGGGGQEGVGSFVLFVFFYRWWWGREEVMGGLVEKEEFYVSIFKYFIQRK